ncbi:Cysteine proteinase 2 [Monoraphidium neglectum]|uniref:Cysteine proteinase 2 n=1 Tax=Monoraphidium neglectum TaxID=145388 RepID=A0A0D2JRU8_9CHLO|nr:Cysteine proteinase 2 [Monoraphidium neglectum]KIZ01703.1 Cysteine proteinase 2 [Monoraphidium neglectum]|eukprot:XP_013900722.1 Cysteine proteinase 2 [Monoraphidium neglectum]
MAASAANVNMFPQSASPDSLDEAVQAQVAAAKAAFAAAFADPDAAFDRHILDLGARKASLLANGRALTPNIAVLGNGSAASLQKYRAAFKQNLIEIAALNARPGANVAYGITAFTHMPKEEFKARYLGGKKASASGTSRAAAVKAAGYTCVKATAWKATALAKAKLVGSVDWRKASPPAVGRVRDQGECGSCVTFANVAALEAAYSLANKIDASTVDLSEQDEMDCTSGDACEGADGYEYIDNAICNKIAFERSRPYTAQDNDRCSTNLARTKPGVVGYAFVPGNINDFRRALAHNVMAIGIDAGDSDNFMN